MGFGTNSSSGSGTGRSGTGFDVNAFNQFLKAIHGTLGGPFSVGDLFTLAPRSQSLFTGQPTGQERPGGGFNLGFGTPPSYAQPPAGAGDPATPPGGGTTPPAPGGGTPAKTFTMSDIAPAWNQDPEKRMDIPRFFRQSRLDPNGFSYEDFQQAVRNVGKYGFSGRSAGNFGNALSLLQNLQTNAGDFGAGKGTGVF